jgi:hypothetical protein
MSFSTWLNHLVLCHPLGLFHLNSYLNTPPLILLTIPFMWPNQCNHLTSKTLIIFWILTSLNILFPVPSSLVCLSLPHKHFVSILKYFIHKGIKSAVSVSDLKNISIGPLQVIIWLRTQAMLLSNKDGKFMLENNFVYCWLRSWRLLKNASAPWS